LFSIYSVGYSVLVFAGTSLALLSATLKKIGFPGWPDPNLDSVSGFGASIQKRGLAPAPFFIFGLPLLPNPLFSNPWQSLI
jgi:hypothetical protein